MMSPYFADPLVSGSPGWREMRDLNDRGIADGLAGRPRASEDSLYNGMYGIADCKRRVLACEAIVAAADGVECEGCGACCVGLVLLHCRCGASNPRLQRRGKFVLYGMDNEVEPAEFRSMEWLRELIADGTPVLTSTGDDITHTIHPVQ